MKRLSRRFAVAATGAGGGDATTFGATATAGNGGHAGAS